MSGSDGSDPCMAAAPSPAACLLAAALGSGFLYNAPFGRMIKESFLILDGSPNHDCWSVARRRDLYRRFSAASIERKPYAHGAPAREGIPFEQDAVTKWA